MFELECKEGQFKGNTSTALSLDAKALSDDGTFEGYASTFGNIDNGDDIMVAGCFTDSLIKRPIERVKMLWQHRTDQPIGKWLEAREDSKGLWVKGKLFLGVQKGKEAYELMREGAVDGLSIGYRTLEDEFDRELGVRRLKKVDLREVSAVTFPMNEMATVSMVKNGALPTEREFERMLVRDAGFTRSQAKVIITTGYKSLHAERDAGEDDNNGLNAALAKLAGAIRA